MPALRGVLGVALNGEGDACQVAGRAVAASSRSTQIVVPTGRASFFGFEPCEINGKSVGSTFDCLTPSWRRSAAATSAAEAMASARFSEFN